MRRRSQSGDGGVLDVAFRRSGVGSLEGALETARASHAGPAMSAEAREAAAAAMAAETGIQEQSGLILGDRAVFQGTLHGVFKSCLHGCLDILDGESLFFH